METQLQWKTNSKLCMPMTMNKLKGHFCCLKPL